MKRTLLTLITLIVSIAAYCTDTLVYILPINDEIGSTTWRHTKRGLEEASQMNASLILLHLNTYGGTVEHADSMRTALLHSPIPVVAFVDNNAASAGALIALACDSVYMRPDASMGAATVVNGNDGTAMPDKYQSYMRAMMRATAEQHGKIKGNDSTWRWRRDPLIAEAMVDTRIVVPGLIDSTKVLTFTPDEAIRWGYADGKADSIDDVIAQLGINHYTTATFRASWVDNLMGFLTSPAIQAILIMIIIGGIYFELQTPGMGFPSLAALTAAILYFLPLFLTGIVSSWVVLLFVGGLILLLVEIFIIPGFGIAGIAGCCAMAGAVIIGLLESFSLPSGHIDITAIWQTILTLAIATAACIALIMYLTSHYGPKFITRTTELTHSQRIEEGYIGVDTSLKRLVGQSAQALTDLRPAGKIIIDDNEYDAVAQRGFIEAGTAVRITRFENAQLYVLPD